LYKHFIDIIRENTEIPNLEYDIQFYKKSPVFVSEGRGLLHSQNLRRTQMFARQEEEYNMGTAIKIRLDGPYGSPSSRIFNSRHAVLIATGIGVRYLLPINVIYH